MTIRAVLAGILLVALAMGALLWWTLTRAYYVEVPASDTSYATVVTATGTAALAVADARAIDAASSPIRFRACATLAAPIPADARPYATPTPLTPPPWFDCFDPAAIDRAIAAGEAQAFLSRANTPYGVDRVVAAFPDGRAYWWHQFNRCGEEVFNGRPPPEGCPPPPADARINYRPDGA